MKLNRKYRLKSALKKSDYRHTKYRHFTEEDWSMKNTELYIGKEEHFSQQFIINALNGDTLYALSKDNLISSKGLTNKVRIDIEGPKDIKEYLKINFLLYIKNDLGVEVAEPIGNMDSLEAENGITQSFIIEGKIPKSFSENLAEIKVNIFVQKNYEDEVLDSTLKIKLNIYDFVFEDPSKNEYFTLDLWQHPSSWGRYYEVGLWTEDHFIIIKNMLEELVSLGDKIITVVVSDFPWSGQMCYEEEDNPSNLFEYNMIRVIKDNSGKFIYDYSNMDRYIEIAISVGMDREIDIFGLSGVWEAGMGSPVKDYLEPLKITYYDESDNKLKYMKNEKEVNQYIQSLINHLDEKDWLKMTKIMSDHPNENRVFEEKKEYLEKIVYPKKLNYKSAIYLKDIIEAHYKKLDEISVCSAALLQLGNKIEDIKKFLNEKKGHATWYVCWFPERPNNFIETPLLDNRLIGWFTYLFGMDGFLRWDFALWTKDPWKKVRFKYPYWKAGDMFFVYPGKNMKPLRSLRWENLRYGIQDFQLFKKLEEKGFERERILEEFIHPLLGKITDYKVKNCRSVKIKFHEEQDDYIKVKRRILEILSKK